jgi:hypothetical protein
VPAPVPIPVPAPVQTYESLPRGWPAEGINGQGMLGQFNGAMMEGVASVQQQMMQAGWHGTAEGTGGEFPYHFQGGGIFGLGGETFHEGEFPDPFAEDYGHVDEQVMEFVSVVF